MQFAVSFPAGMTPTGTLRIVTAGNGRRKLRVACACCGSEPRAPGAHVRHVMGDLKGLQQLFEYDCLRTAEGKRLYDVAFERFGDGEPFALFYVVLFCIVFILYCAKKFLA